MAIRRKITVTTEQAVSYYYFGAVLDFVGAGLLFIIAVCSGSGLLAILGVILLVRGIGQYTAALEGKKKKEAADEYFHNIINSRIDRTMYGGTNDQIASVLSDKETDELEELQEKVLRLLHENQMQSNVNHKENKGSTINNKKIRGKSKK